MLVFVTSVYSTLVFSVESKKYNSVPIGSLVFLGFFVTYFVIAQLSLLHETHHEKSLCLDFAHLPHFIASLPT